MPSAFFKIAPQLLFQILRHLTNDCILNLYGSCRHFRRALRKDAHIINHLRNKTIYSDPNLIGQLYDSRGHYARYVKVVDKFYSIEDFRQFSTIFSQYLLKFTHMFTFYQPVMIGFLEKHPSLENAVMVGRAEMGGDKEASNCLKLACHFGHAIVAEQIIKSSIISNIEECMLAAAKQGHYKLVQRLLQLPNCDPRIGNQEVFRVACLDGNSKVVEILLNDSRIDPTVNNHEGLLWACKYGHKQTVTMLLSDVRVDPCQNKALMYMAVKWNQTEILKMLLQDGRIDISDIRNDLVDMAVEFSYNDILSLISLKPTLSCTQGTMQMNYCYKQLIIEILGQRVAVFTVIMVILSWISILHL